MRIAIKTTGIIAIGLICAASQAAELSPKYDGAFYYRLGGARAFTASPRLEITNIDLSFKASVSGLACGKFDPKVTMESTLNAVKDGVDDSMQQLETAASAAISALPGYILQSIDPGLYDLFMNSVFRAEDKFSLATKSCEQISAEIARGENPYEDIVTVAIGDSWKQSVGVGADITTVAAAAASDEARNAGVSWVGGDSAGGEGMDPLWLSSDPVKAGYNILLGRDPASTDAVLQTDDTPPIAKRFQSPAEIQTWVRAVVGDVFAATCAGCDNGSISGQGLRALLEDEKTTLKDRILDLYYEDEEPTLSSLNEVSAPGVQVTLQVLETIQGQEVTDADIFLSKLTDEVALSRVINDALMVNQALRTGAKESNVVAIPKAQESAKETIAAIDSEIESLLKEAQIKRSLVSATVGEVLMLGHAQQLSGYRAPTSGRKDPRPLVGNSVRE